jgi:pimeloyl-ACP methyl ester carboxylesterase
MGVTQPPKVQKKTRTLARALFLLVLLAAAATTIWHVTTQNNIRLIETGSVASLNVDPGTLFPVAGLRLRVVQHSSGQDSLVLLHDADVGGSVSMTQLVEETVSEFMTVTVDLPGFGLSSRIPEPGPPHTVGSMADSVADVLSQVFTRPVVLAGAGLGGKVAAEIAVRRPELVDALVMIDVDFWEEDTWRQRAQKLPLIGRSMTYTYETSGRFALPNWAPRCGDGGWCPTPQQRVDREAAARIADSTASLHAFINTPQASLVPSDLGEIQVPTVYIWSLKGNVPRTSVERIKTAIPHMAVVDVDTWMAHTEMPGAVRDAMRLIDR